jgi:hypothetical protein
MHVIARVRVARVTTSAYFSTTPSDERSMSGGLIKKATYGTVKMEADGMC